MQWLQYRRAGEVANEDGRSRLGDAADGLPRQLAGSRIRSRCSRLLETMRSKVPSEASSDFARQLTSKRTFALHLDDARPGRGRRRFMAFGCVDARARCQPTWRIATAMVIVASARAAAECRASDQSVCACRRRVQISVVRETRVTQSSEVVRRRDRRRPRRGCPSILVTSVRAGGGRKDLSSNGY